MKLTDCRSRHRSCRRWGMRAPLQRVWPPGSGGRHHAMWDRVLSPNGTCVSITVLEPSCILPIGTHL